MRKLIALLLCLGLASPVYAAPSSVSRASSGGGTSSGSSGDIQYNDGSNGFGAETALNYDAAINTLYADIFSASGSSGKITGNTYGEYLDFLSGGDGIITLGGDGSGGTARTLKFLLEGAYTSIIPSQSVLNFYSTYSSAQGINILGKLALGNTFLSANSYLNLFDNFSSPSYWIGVNNILTQTGSGNLTGVLVNTTTTSTGQLVAGVYESTKSGSGSSNVVYGVLGKANFTGTGTQVLVNGLVGNGTVNNAGGTITNFHGVRAESATVVAGAVTYNYAIGSKGKFYFEPQTQTIADNGNGGTAASATITVTSGVVRLTCSDAQGCDMTLSESGIIDGTKLEISNGSANVCNFSDTSGVTELAGAFAMGQYDSLSLTYHSDRWVEDARSDN